MNEIYVLPKFLLLLSLLLLFLLNYSLLQMLYLLISVATWTPKFTFLIFHLFSRKQRSIKLRVIKFRFYFSLWCHFTSFSSLRPSAAWRHEYVDVTSHMRHNLRNSFLKRFPFLLSYYYSRSSFLVVVFSATILYHPHTY